MKCDITDKAAMGMAAAACAGCGALSMMSPDKAQDMMWTGVMRHDNERRMNGHSMMACAAMMMGTMDESAMSAKGRKDMFKVTGAVMGTLAAHSGMHMYKGNMKKDANNYTQLAVVAGISALHLWKGFKEDKMK